MLNLPTRRNTLRRWLTIAAFSIALLPGLAIAQEQVTVVIRDTGERVSGTFEDLADNTVYVRVSLHDQRRIPLNSIAVIDFGSGQYVPQAEAGNVAGGQHVLVTRDGQRLQGRLLNIEGGQGSAQENIDRVVSFRTSYGEERRVRADQVARIYLTDVPSPAATSGTSSTMPMAGTTTGAGISVPASRQWTRTGITVRQGDIVQFNSSGQIYLSRDPNDVAGPAGATSGRNAAGAPVPALAGALIGRVGNGQPFGIGDQTQVRMPASGELWLGVNDDAFNDNQGEFRVEVMPQRQLPRRR